MDTLLVVGAGPKALAVAAKASVLKELGYPAPRVVAIEQHAVGGNWLPGGGWTDGNHRLGTSPEKDIGFPYRSNLVQGHNREINEKMLTFSWTSFLVDHGGFTEWIDRGRPSPQHHMWAKYLQWVAKKAQLELVVGSVRSMSCDTGEWSLTVEGPNGQTIQCEGDALMITGPGSSKSALYKHPRMLSVAEFWDLAGRRQLPLSSRAAVIGGGETAGSVLDELARHDAMSISVVSPMATLYTRGESYFENSLYSDPTKWIALTNEEKRDVIRRTDRGVFSVRVQETLLGDNRVSHLQGRVVRAKSDGDLLALTLNNGTRGDRTHTFDLVVDATGGQPLWFVDLMDQDAADVLELSVGSEITQERIEASIGYDLSVESMTPKLFLPNLAGVSQGPGFPNLSCLGMLSDRVLRSDVVEGSTRSRKAARALRDA